MSTVGDVSSDEAAWESEGDSDESNSSDESSPEESDEECDVDTLTEEELELLQECVESYIMEWVHPAGDDYHLHMTEERARKLYERYVNYMSTRKHKLDADWSLSIDDMVADFKKAFDKVLPRSLARQVIMMGLWGEVD